MLALQREHPGRIRGYVTVNPNYTTHALAEIARGVGGGHDRHQARRQPARQRSAARSGLRRRRGARVARPAPHLAAPARASTRDRRRPTRVELGELAARHPARAVHPGAHRRRRRLAALAPRPFAPLANVYVDLSGSGVDGGMLEACLAAVGVGRLLWGCDLTIDTGWAKLRYLEQLLPPAELERVRWRNAAAHLPRRRVPVATDAHRRQRLRRRVPVAPVPGTSPAGAPRRDGPRRHRRGLGHAPARRLLARPHRGQRLAARDRRTRAALRPVPAVHPGAGRLGARRCRGASDAGAPAVRADPTFYGIDPAGRRHARARGGVRRGRHAAPARGAVRGRPAASSQRPGAPSCPPSAVRALIRSDPRVRLLVTHADRAFIEEVHFGSTPEEAARIWWDICWIWGPPEDHLRDAARHHRRRAVRVRHRAAAPAAGERRRQARPARPVARGPRGHRSGQRARAARPMTPRTRAGRPAPWHAGPGPGGAGAVPRRRDRRGRPARLRRTGWRRSRSRASRCGPTPAAARISPAEQRRVVLDAWREALPDRLVIAGARDITMAIEARRGRADAHAGLSRARDPVGVSPAAEPRAAGHRLLALRGGRRRGLRRCHAARASSTSRASSASRSPRSTR